MVKFAKKGACRRDVSVSAAHQGEGSPARRKVARQTRIDPKRKKERNATGLNRVAKKSLYFDPQALLATIGEGMKSVLLKRKQRIFAQGDTADVLGDPACLAGYDVRPADLVEQQRLAVVDV